MTLNLASKARSHFISITDAETVARHNVPGGAGQRGVTGPNIWKSFGAFVVKIGH